MMDERAFDLIASKTLERILVAFDEVDPDVVEPIESAGVLQFEFPDGRRRWVVNSQAAAKQIWLAAEQRAWHFAHTSEDLSQQRWVCSKTGDELFATLTSMLKEHAQVDVDF